MPGVGFSLAGPLGFPLPPSDHDSSATTEQSGSSSSSPTTAPTDDPAAATPAQQQQERSTPKANKSPARTVRSRKTAVSPEEDEVEDDNNGEPADDAPANEDASHTINFDLGAADDSAEEVRLTHHETSTPAHIANLYRTLPFFFRGTYRFLCLHSYPIHQIQKKKKHECRNYSPKDYMSTVLCIASVKDDLKDTFGPSVPSILPMHFYFVVRFLDVTKPKKKPYKHGFELDPPIPLPSGVKLVSIWHMRNAKKCHFVLNALVW